MPFFLVFILLLYCAGNIYVFRRGAQALRDQPRGVKILLSILYWCGAILFPFIFFLARRLDLQISPVHNLYEIGTGWLVFTLYMTLLLLVFDLINLLFKRFYFKFYLALGITLCLLSYGYYHYQNPSTRLIKLNIDKPVAEGSANKIRIVAVSDIHLGYGTDKAKLNEYVDLINAQDPDIILIGGDLIDSNVATLRSQRMDEELAKLNAPMGIYMVLGNHEYISGVDESISFIKKTPINLLRDQIITLPNNIQIAGRDDRHNPSRFSIQALAANLDTLKPVILLDHQPYGIGLATEKADLLFYGHTHQGQIWPLSLIADYLFEQSHGLRLWGKCWVYMSSGLSLWGPPFRIGTDSELVVFDITLREQS